MRKQQVIVRKKKKGKVEDHAEPKKIYKDKSI